jgi:hypothetical protein
MRLQIVQIYDRGVANKERILLRASAETNLSSYIVFNTWYITPQAISRSPRNVFWFPPKPIKPGDSVVLFSGLGTPSESQNQDGTTTYFFFWGLANTIWNKTGDCATLVELNNWMTSVYE